MSERDDIFGTAAAPGDGVPERARERALAAQRLAEAAQRLAPAHGIGAQRAAWQDAQVASIMAAEALEALPGDAELARAMADEARSMAIEALKAAQVAALEQSPAEQAAAPAQPPLAQAVPEAVQPAASEPASHTAWREAVPALVPEAPQGQPDAVSESAAAKPTDPAQEPFPEPAAEAAGTEGVPGSSSAPVKRSHKLRTACIALAGVLLVMVGLVGAAWLGLFRLPDPVQERLYLLPDAHAQAGRLNAAETEVVPGSFQLVLNQLCSMEQGSLDCPIEFENPESNQYSARISLEIDGQELARSGMVAPGSYLPALRLDGELAPGDHEARAVVYVYSGATQVNTLASDVTVRVK